MAIWKIFTCESFMGAKLVNQRWHWKINLWKRALVNAVSFQRYFQPLKFHLLPFKVIYVLCFTLSVIDSSEWQIKTNTLELNIVAMTAWKESKYGVFSGLYFPVFELNTEIYGVNSPNTGKYRPQKTQYSDTFHTVYILNNKNRK